MTEKFGGLIQAKCEALAETHAQTKLGEIEETLNEDLAGRFQIERGDKCIIVSGPDIEREILDNDSLRDIAFLMRGVR